MVQFKVKKDFIGTVEKQTFKKNQKVELTLKRADAIQKNIDKQYPEYGEVLERVEEKPKVKEKE